MTLFVTFSTAQNTRIDGTVFDNSGHPRAGAFVAVCLQPNNSTVTPCVPTAPLCASIADLVCSQPNPVTTDGLGNYHFYVATGILYTLQIYGTALTTQVLPDQIGTSSLYGPPSAGIPSTVLPTAVTSIKSFGDSITAGGGVPIAQAAWPQLVANGLGISNANFSNLAVSGSRINTNGQIPTAYLQTVSASIGSMSLLGTNEMPDAVANAANIPLITSGQQAMLVWLALTPSQKVLATAMTQTGVWGTAPQMNLTTESSNTAGSTLTGTVTGTVVYVAGWISTGFNQNFTVTVDGVSQGVTTFTGQGALTSSGVYPFCLRFPGFTSGSHTVVLTANGGNYGIFQWIAGNGTTTQAPFVAVGNALPQGVVSDTVIGNVNSALLSTVNNLHTDGLNVVYVDDNSVMTKSATPAQYSANSGGNLHPNVLGNFLIAAKWLKTVFSPVSLNNAAITPQDLIALFKMFINQPPPPYPSGATFGATCCDPGQFFNQYSVNGNTGLYGGGGIGSTIIVPVALTAQGAAKGSTLLYTPPAAQGSMYCAVWDAVVTQAASVSSTLGGTNGFQLTFTDNNTNTVITPLAIPTASGTGNTIGTYISGVTCANVKGNTNLSYQFDYTSAGGTPMQYALNIYLMRM